MGKCCTVICHQCLHVCRGLHWVVLHLCSTASSWPLGPRRCCAEPIAVRATRRRKNEFVMRPQRPQPIVALHKFFFSYLRACFFASQVMLAFMLVFILSESSFLPCYPGKVVGSMASLCDGHRRLVSVALITVMLHVGCSLLLTYAVRWTQWSCALDAVVV